MRSRHWLMLVAGVVGAVLVITIISAMSRPTVQSRELTISAPGQYGPVERAAVSLVLGARPAAAVSRPDPANDLFTEPQVQGVLRINDETYAAAFRDRADVAGKPTTVWAVVLLSMLAGGPQLRNKVVACDRTGEGLAVALPGEDGLLFFALGSVAARTVPFADKPSTRDQGDPVQAWWADHEHVDRAEVAYLTGLENAHFC